INTNVFASQKLTRRVALGLLFGFGVLLVLVLAGDLRQVSERVWTFRWGLYPLVIALTLFNYTLRFFKWHFYLRLIGVRELPLIESARLFVAGFPLSVTPGKVGEALKAVWLNQAVGVAVGRGVAVVLAERISDGLAVLSLSALGVIAYPRYWPAFASGLVLLLGIIVISQVRPLALAILGIGERLPVVRRFAHTLHEFYEGSFVLFRPKATLVAVGLGIISWLGEGIGFYVILVGLGIAPGWETLSVAVFILSFSTVIGALSTLPGGLGAAEVSIAGMLVLLLGLDTGLSATATLLIRFATLWFGVGLGLAVWVFSKELLGFGNG
ncbi:MAG TPA: lysylphosphatidylglycerol synthase transmembrane domain-containing protein, partial [Anaerolineales bacterium]